MSGIGAAHVSRSSGFNRWHVVCLGGSQSPYRRSEELLSARNSRGSFRGSFLRIVFALGRRHPRLPLVFRII